MAREICVYGSVFIATYVNVSLHPHDMVVYIERVRDMPSKINKKFIHENQAHRNSFINECKRV